MLSVSLPTILLACLGASSAFASGDRLFPSIHSGADWLPNWRRTRYMDHAHQYDPKDDRAQMRGSGSIDIGDGTLKMSGSPRLYIHRAAGYDNTWNNVEFTAYGKLPESVWTKSYSGITLVTRSSHNLYTDNPCAAHGYYARLYFETGQVGIQKEFYHNAQKKETLYTNSERVKNLRVDRKWFTKEYFGIKFVVRTRPDGRTVNLQVFIDADPSFSRKYPTFGRWSRVVNFDDADWSKSHKNFPCRYSYAPGGSSKSYKSPVLRPGQVSFLRTDGVKQLIWKNVSVREIAPLNCQNCDGNPL